MTTIKEVTEWLISHDIQISAKNIEITNGVVNVACPVSMYNCQIESIPFKFGETGDFDFGENLMKDLTNTPDYTDGTFSFDSSPNLETLTGGPEAVGQFDINWCPNLVSLKNVPKRMMRFSSMRCPKLLPYEYRYLLLSQVLKVQTAIPSLDQILNTGRIQGIMPSELIPGKIKQLRELK